jgi:hypothetical protein
MALLHDMRQLVRKQASSLLCLTREPTRAKHNVLSHRVGVGVYILRPIVQRLSQNAPHLGKS